ncbi:MAG: 3-deoxy-D-manno-octulosonate 8-phosphate phosphatase [Gammaproteobacteria bacterium]|nr:3-deoxy-D-manno-octulosonate 8-phosphate phosphatase [Gammaproteobacteria bacterium]
MELLELRTVAAGIRLLVLDVDGVLTDGRLHYDSDGRETKSFHVRDGYGIQQVLAAGLLVAVISGRRSAAAAARLAELRVPHVYLGRNDKREVLQNLVAELGIPLPNVACVGDDVTDLEIMGLAGLGITVADSHPDVRRAADWVTGTAGGQGAVREVCDYLLAARQPA